MQCCKIKKNKSEQIGRHKKCFTVKLGAAVGEPFGSTFKVVNTSDRRGYDLEKMTLHDLQEFSLMQDDGACGEDNRHLKDDGSSQSLSTEDIRELRRKGASGEEVVQTLLSNSATFASKTAFSQEKYIKRKGKKYTQPITIHRPTVDMLADMLYRNAPAKISNLRMDTLFQVVCYANAAPGSRVAVYDSGSLKLVLSAVLAAVGGGGRVVDVCAGFPSMAGTAMSFMDFSDEQLSAVAYLEMENLHTIPFPDGTDVDTSALKVDPNFGCKHSSKVSNSSSKPDSAAPVSDLKTVSDDSTNREDSVRSDTNILSSSSADSLPSADDVNSVDINTCAGEDTASSSVHTNEEANGSLVNGADSVPESCDGKLTDEDGVTRKISKKNSKPSNQTFKMRFVRSRGANLELSRQVLSAGAESLVVSCGYRNHPLEPLVALWPYLLPGCPFVVSCPYLQPLEEVYQRAKALGGTNLHASETFLREYQCLPERTHPHVMMSAGGGYLLRGTKAALPE